MAFSNFPGGTTSDGIPQLGAGVSIPNLQGLVFFVGPVGVGDGTDPSAPLPSITAALSRCVSGSGSTIFVFPGTYNENVVVTKDAISIIGCVNSGYERPDVTPDTGVALTVTAQGFYCRHVRFASSNNDSVVQHGNGAVYEDCVFDGDSGQAVTKANLRFVPGADDSYSASECTVANSLFRGSGGSGIIFQHALAAAGGEGTTDNVITGCRFVANTTSDLLSAVNTNGGGAGIYQNLSVTDCQFMTVGASYVYIDFSAGAAGDLTSNSGLISGNFFADEALIASQIDLGGQAHVMFAGNFDAVGLVDGSTFNN